MVNQICTKKPPLYYILANEPKDEELQGKVIKCLKVKFTEAKLTTNCEHQVAALLREQALNYHLDPLLSTMCRPEIETICKPSDNSDTNADGEVRIPILICMYLSY